MEVTQTEIYPTHPPTHQPTYPSLFSQAEVEAFFLASLYRNVTGTEPLTCPSTTHLTTQHECLSRESSSDMKQWLDLDHYGPDWDSFCTDFI